MELHQLLLHLLLALSAVRYAASASDSKDRFDRLLIDTGASQATYFNDSDLYTYQWLTDSKFTDSGQNFVFTLPNLSFPMNSLRFFPSGSEDCYDLPCYVYLEQKFLFRVGFFYGNYDGLSRPPRFNLTIDGHFWTTVETSMNQEPVYYELIYRTRKPGAKLCLVRSEKDQVPFVSSIEVFPMPWGDGLYKYMENDTALFLHSRINYGANQTIEKDIGHWEEGYGRIWKSNDKTEYLNIQANRIPDGSVFRENIPPWAVLGTAIQAQSKSSSISLPVNFSSQSNNNSNNVTAYFVLYFKDPVARNPNRTSSVDIYINQKKLSNVDIPDWFGPEDKYRVVSLYPVLVNGTATVTISPANGRELPPLLNGMEVFSVINVSKADILVAPCFTLLGLFLVNLYSHLEI